MRIIAIILSVVGLFLLSVVADLRWGFMPLHVAGPEGGFIVLAEALVAGIAVSVVATFLAALHLRRAPVASSAWLLAWCCVVMAGFAAMFVG
jgi:hypothetical protein